jgi:transposase
VIVANARQVKLISQSSRKDDRWDAQTLARADPQLLRPIRHRSEAAQLHLMTIRVRAGLVEARTARVNTARRLAKAIGERLPACGASQWSEERIEEAELPEAVRETLRPDPASGHADGSDPQVRRNNRADRPEHTIQKPNFSGR